MVYILSSTGSQGVFIAGDCAYVFQLDFVNKQAINLTDSDIESVIFSREDSDGRFSMKHDPQTPQPHS